MATKKTTTKKAAGTKPAAKKTTPKKAPVKKAPASDAKAVPKAKPAKKAAGKLSAIDAAAQVLAAAKEPMTTKELIEAMAEQKLWISPGGKTPERTLYSAITREINLKGKEARFTKAERGKFARAK